MKNSMLRLWPAILVVAAGPRLAAQVLDVNQFETTVYLQTNAAPPAAPNFPNTCFFGTYMDADPGDDVTNVIVYSPGAGVLPLNQYSPAYFENSTPYYSNITNLNTDYPGGTYDYNFNYADIFSNFDNADVIFDVSTNDLHATSIPAFTPACWTAMQSVDPAQSFILNWNAYTLTSGADYAFTFITISDHSSGLQVISPSGPPGITATNIPAGTLLYGRVYDVSLYFSERQTPPDQGISDAQITVGWDNLTMATLQTLPLWLQIAPAGTNVLLTWPAAATNYQLQAAASLSAASAWNVVTNQPVVSGTMNFLTLPAANPSTFFRLSTF
jgi:hypothetical protein